MITIEVDAGDSPQLASSVWQFRHNVTWSSTPALHSYRPKGSNMLLRQQFVRGDAHQPSSAVSATLHSPAFRVFRQRPPTDHAAAASSSCQQTAQRPAETEKGHTGQAWQQLLQAQPLEPAAVHPAAEPAAGWRIPPQQWQEHPTLLSGCGVDSMYDNHNLSRKAPTSRNRNHMRSATPLAA